MNVIEYLQDKLEPEYRFYSSTLPIVTTPDMPVPFIINEKVYGCGKFNIGSTWYKLVKDNSIEGAIFYGLTNSLITRIKHPEIATIAKRVQSKILNVMITDIHNSNSKTELVQLRIAVNMIMNLTYLDSDKRLEWSNWIKELYWKRKAVINQYILDYILPF